MKQCLKGCTHETLARPPNGHQCERERSNGNQTRRKLILGHAPIDGQQSDLFDGRAGMCVFPDRCRLVSCMCKVVSFLCLRVIAAHHQYIADTLAQHQPHCALRLKDSSYYVLMLCSLPP
jgi:hypothetical protein